MIGQRQRHAVAQRRFGNLVLCIQQDAAVTAKAQFLRVQLAKGFDQVGLAVEIHRVLVGGGFHLIDPDRAAAFRLGREIAWLAPFQGFLQCADTLWWSSRHRRSGAAAPAIWLSAVSDRRRKPRRPRVPPFPAGFAVCPGVSCRSPFCVVPFMPPSRTPVSSIVPLRVERMDRLNAIPVLGPTL